MESQRTISEEHDEARSEQHLPPRTKKDQGIQVISLPGEEKKGQQKTQGAVPVQQCHTLHQHRTLLRSECFTSLKETPPVRPMTGTLAFGDTSFT